MDKMIGEIQKDIKKLADPETKEKIIKLTSGAKCYGVTVPKLRQLAKDYKNKLKDTCFTEIIKMANYFFEHDNREEILFIIFLIANNKKEKLSIGWETIELWVNHLDNWETCDQLSSNIVTDIIVKNIILVKELKKLAKSENLWLRRFSIATLANMNHGGRQYPKETFEIAKLLLKDKETMVLKALGWAIRELSKDCPKETIEFLKENRKIISDKLTKDCIELLSEAQKKIFIDK